MLYNDKEFNSYSESTIATILDVIHSLSEQNRVAETDQSWMLDFVYDHSLQRAFFNFVDEKFGENKLVEYVS